MKTFSDKVIATSFPYPMVHRSIAGDVPTYLTLLKVIHHSENAAFDRFRVKTNRKSSTAH